jgi:hypothetical protein
MLSKTSVHIDVRNQKINIKFGHESKQIILDFFVASKRKKKINFSGVSFGYQIQDGEGKVIEEFWPMSGVGFGYVNPGIITSSKIKLRATSDYKLLIWCDFNGIRRSKTKMFNTGFPLKAHNSMIWNKETQEWEMLKPYPEDTESLYVWNEEELEWQKFQDLTKPS